VAELDAEAAAQFERASAAEEEAGAAQATAHASAQQLQDALLQMQVPAACTCTCHEGWAGQGAQLDAGAVCERVCALQELRSALADAEAKAGAAPTAEAEEEVAQLRAEAEEKEAEFGDLLSCLGQESAKVAALQGLLGQHGIDASALLAEARTLPLFLVLPASDLQELSKSGFRALCHACGICTRRNHDPLQVEAEYGADGEEAGEQDEEEQQQEAAAAHATTADEQGMAPAAATGEGSIEGLPEGELLSPEKEGPQMQPAQAQQISAKLGGEGAAQGAWDGWDAEDAQGDWGDT
jgi:hypothetical protein